MNKVFFKSIISTLLIVASYNANAGLLVGTLNIENASRTITNFRPSAAFSTPSVRIVNIGQSARNVTMMVDGHDGEVIRESVRIEGHSIFEYEVPDSVLTGGSTSDCSLEFYNFVVDAIINNVNTCESRILTVSISWSDNIVFSPTSSAAGGHRNIIPLVATVINRYEASGGEINSAFYRRTLQVEGESLKQIN